MKKLLVVLGFLLLASSISAFAQGNYFVDYYSNNVNPLAADQVIRAINTGTYGTPLTSNATGTGDICENVYVFDNNQEMVSCCACGLTPDELSSAAVGAQLTNHALTGTAPVAGVVKLVFTLPASFNGPTGCRAETGVGHARVRRRLPDRPPRLRGRARSVCGGGRRVPRARRPAGQDLRAPPGRIAALRWQPPGGPSTTSSPAAVGWANCSPT